MRRQVLRFGLVGLCTFGLDFLTYRTLLALDVAISPAKAAGFLVGTSAAYLLNRLWTFRSRQGRPTLRSVVAFALLYGTTLLVNVAVNALTVQALTGQPGRIEIAFLVAQAVTSTLNFLGMRYLVFPDGRASTDQ